MYYSLRLIFLSLIVVLVGTGCASHYVVPGFDGGKRPSDQVGLLKVPEVIKILRVNGKRQDRFMLSSLTLDYQLLPGGNRIEYQYASLWAVAGGSSANGDKSSELVKSKIQEIAFNVKAGETYHFDYKQAANRVESKVIAEPFMSTLKDSGNRMVATGVLYVDKKKVVQAAIKSLPVVANTLRTEVSAKSALTNMDALQMFWGKASAAEKKAFLKWAFK